MHLPALLERVQTDHVPVLRLGESRSLPGDCRTGLSARSRIGISTASARGVADRMWSSECAVAVTCCEVSTVETMRMPRQVPGSRCDRSRDSKRAGPRARARDARSRGSRRSLARASLCEARAGRDCRSSPGCAANSSCVSDTPQTRISATVADSAFVSALWNIDRISVHAPAIRIPDQIREKSQIPVPVNVTAFECSRIVTQPGCSQPPRCRYSTIASAASPAAASSCRCGSRGAPAARRASRCR